jgi:hypothetical protein
LGWFIFHLNQVTKKLEEPIRKCRISVHNVTNIPFWNIRCGSYTVGLAYPVANSGSMRRGEYLEDHAIRYISARVQEGITRS